MFSQLAEVVPLRHQFPAARRCERCRSRDGLTLDGLCWRCDRDERARSMGLTDTLVRTHERQAPR